MVRVVGVIRRGREVWEYERERVSEVVYDYESEVRILR